MSPAMVIAKDPHQRDIRRAPYTPTSNAFETFEFRGYKKAGDGVSFRGARGSSRGPAASSRRRAASTPDEAQNEERAV
jgi:hypothetical protein